MLGEPLIPFVEIPDLTLVPRDFFGSGFPPAPFSIKPFGTLVAIGTYLGAWLVLREGRRLGFHEKALTSFVVYVGVSGFALGHVLDTVLYYPERALHDPLSVVRFWDGLSSFGGFTGALVGGLLWRLRYRVPILPYADIVGSTFPAGWVFGRMGCSVAHDHPGVRSELWLAVRYPDGGRIDLGLFEMLLTVPLALAFLSLRGQQRPWGFYLATMCLAYAPTRFALDFLRARDTPLADVRYSGFTPAQWACFALLGLGVWLCVGMMRRLGTPAAFEPPRTPDAFDAAPTDPGPGSEPA